MESIRSTAMVSTWRLCLPLTHEQIVGLWTHPADTKELHQVVELAMYISAYLRGVAMSGIGKPA